MKRTLLIYSFLTPLLTFGAAFQPPISAVPGGNNSGIVVKKGSNIVLTTNANEVTINATTDTNVVNILITNGVKSLDVWTNNGTFHYPVVNSNSVYLRNVDGSLFGGKAVREFISDYFLPPENTTVFYPFASTEYATNFIQGWMSPMGLVVDAGSTVISGGIYDGDATTPGVERARLKVGGFGWLDNSLIILQGQNSTNTGLRNYARLTIDGGAGAVPITFESSTNLAPALIVGSSVSILPLTNATANQALISDGGTPQQLSWIDIPASAQDLWRTNTVEGGIWWSNNNGSAKFGPLATGTFVSGYTNAGGVLKADAPGATVFGAAEANGAQIFADADGAFAFGEVDVSGRIAALELGSFAGGHANGIGSAIVANQPGTIAFGNALSDGDLKSDLDGAVSLGYASSAGSIESRGFGSLAVGKATGAGAILRSESAGSLASGFADGPGSIISAHVNGSIASGVASGSGLLDAQNVSSHVFGYVNGSGAILGGYSQSGLVNGYADSNSIIVAGVFGATGPAHTADFAGGFAYGTGSKIWADGLSSIAYGVSTNAGFLTATGTVAVTFGQNVGNESAGGFSFAYGKNFTNRNPDTFILGWSSTPSLVVNGDANVPAVEIFDRSGINTNIVQIYDTDKSHIFVQVEANGNFGVSNNTWVNGTSVVMTNLIHGTNLFQVATATNRNLLEVVKDNTVRINGVGATGGLVVKGSQTNTALAGVDNQLVGADANGHLVATAMVNFRQPTNSWAGPTANIDLALCTNGTATLDYTATANCTVSGFINKPSTNDAFIILTITNSTGSDITLTLPTPVTTDDGLRVYTVTNKLARSVWIHYYFDRTNGSSRLWY